MLRVVFCLSQLGDTATFASGSVPIFILSHIESVDALRNRLVTKFPPRYWGGDLDVFGRLGHPRMAQPPKTQGGHS